jgi:ATP-binding cassette subfamily C protein
MPEISAAVVGTGNEPRPSSKRTSRQAALSTAAVANQA